MIVRMSERGRLFSTDLVKASGYAPLITSLQAKVSTLTRMSQPLTSSTHLSSPGGACSINLAASLHRSSMGGSAMVDDLWNVVSLS